MLALALIGDSYAGMPVKGSVNLGIQEERGSGVRTGRETQPRYPGVHARQTSVLVLWKPGRGPSQPGWGAGWEIVPRRGLLREASSFVL